MNSKTNFKTLTYGREVWMTGITSRTSESKVSEKICESLIDVVTNRGERDYILQVLMNRGSVTRFIKDQKIHTMHRNKLNYYEQPSYECIEEKNNVVDSEKIYIIYGVEKDLRAFWVPIVIYKIQ